ncbi:alternative ribosome rescue aminoacyl-tRNA hydrolase ArfB [Seonamhaeicola maritimus]|uniref:alternative ribosome rescue aminoacyl-tRNA hydrolase ArfB n=1 Tax=Seonamhaeicola maritimus TaxID=2591822 RepID=UPI0029393C6E|nr:alternative ribosome rescue aminoacyl-tRNA hydrolase ArfB [Seonamhaeicola maritimus]
MLKELTFKAVRSSGSGGQHVNKVASKTELLFNLKDSKALSEDQKNLLLLKLQNRLTKEGLLILQCDETRSQHKNKGLVIKRFFDIIRGSLTVQKRRISTKTPKSVIRKRLKNKRIKSEKKANRRKPNID